MKHVYLAMATCLSLTVASCGSDEKLRSTNAGPIDGEGINDTITNFSEKPVLVNKNINTTDSITEHSQTIGVDSVAEQIAQELKNTQEAVQQKVTSKYATEIDAIEHTINSLVDRATQIDKGDAKSVVEFAHEMNSARSRLNKILKSADLSSDERARITTLLSKLQSVK